MTKIFFDHLSIQITQRCNLACAHCYRGDACSEDMPAEVIDALLDQTGMVMRLNIGGGEPTLAPQTLEYLISGIIKRDIPIGYAAVTINGATKSKAFAKQIRRLNDYAHASIQKRYNTEMADDINRCGITISNDLYHERQGINLRKRMEALLFYTQQDIPTMIQERQKNDFLAMGRASGGMEGINTGIIDRFHAIDFCGIDGDIMIGDGDDGDCLELMTDGSLILEGGTNNTYPSEHPEGVLCNVLTDSIADAIEAWNGRYPNERQPDNEHVGLR